MRSLGKTAIRFDHFAGVVIILIACFGCGSIESAMPSATTTLALNKTVSPSPILSTPSLTPTPKPTQESTLPFDITIKTVNELVKQPSKVAISWESTLGELPAGEYILIQSPCPAGGDCNEISAFSFADKKMHTLVSVSANIRWATALQNDHFFVAVGEQFDTIQALDLRDQSDYSITLGGYYDGLENIARWDLIYIWSKHYSPASYLSVKEDKQFVLSNSFYYLIGAPNYLVANTANEKDCHPFLLRYQDMKVIPLKTDCDNPLLTWGYSPSGQWLWALDTDEKTLVSSLVVIPGGCLLTHTDDIEYCHQEEEIIIHFQSEFRCYRPTYWTKDEQAIIRGTSDNSDSCSFPGARLYGADGSETIVKSYPGELTDKWTTDGKWVIWNDIKTREWGLYSPYDGGKIQYLGKGLVYDFQIVQVP